MLSYQDFIDLREHFRTVKMFESVRDSDRGACFKLLPVQFRTVEVLEKYVPEDQRRQCFIYLKQECRNLSALKLLKNKDRADCFPILGKEYRTPEAFKEIPEEDRGQCFDYLNDEYKKEAIKLLPPDHPAYSYYVKKYRKLNKKMGNIISNNDGIETNSDVPDDLIDELGFLKSNLTWNEFRRLPDRLKDSQMLLRVIENDRGACFKLLPDEFRTVEVFEKCVPENQRSDCFEALDFNDRSLATFERLVPPLARHECFRYLKPDDRNLNAFKLVADYERGACFGMLNNASKAIEALKEVPATARAGCFPLLNEDDRNLEAFEAIPPEDREDCLHYVNDKYKQAAIKLLSPERQALYAGKYEKLNKNKRKSSISSDGNISTDENTSDDSSKEMYAVNLPTNASFTFRDNDNTITVEEFKRLPEGKMSEVFRDDKIVPSENKHEYFQYLPLSERNQGSLAVVPPDDRHKCFKHLNKDSLNKDALALIPCGKHKDECGEFLNSKRLKEVTNAVRKTKGKVSEKNKKEDRLA